MKVKSNVKAGTGNTGNNHSQVVKGLRVKSNIKAGIGPGGDNHNQTITGLRVKSRVKAGEWHPQHNQTVTRAA